MPVEHQWSIFRRLGTTPSVTPHVPGKLSAGAARVDITPDLNRPLCGYGYVSGSFARGYQRRLFAKSDPKYR